MQSQASNWATLSVAYAPEDTSPDTRLLLCFHIQNIQDRAYTLAF